MFGSATKIHFDYQRNTRHDHAKRIHLDELDEEFAYFMGVLTGDGCLTFRNRVILSSSDAPILDCFYRTAARLGLHVFHNGSGRPYDRIIASSQLYQLLQHLGMSATLAAEKCVPRSILRAPREIVAAYLRGLFDADAHTFLAEKQISDFYMARIIDQLGRAPDPHKPELGLDEHCGPDPRRDPLN